MRSLVLTAALAVAALGAADAQAEPTFLPSVPVSAPGADTVAPAAGFDGRGEALVAFSRNLPDGAVVVQLGQRPPGGQFAVRDLTPAARGGGATDLAVNAAGDAVVAWEFFDGANTRIQAIHRSAGGEFGPVQDLSAPGRTAFFPRVAVNARGDAVVAFSRKRDAADQAFSVQAAVLPAGADAFGAVKDLSEPGIESETTDVGIDGAGNAFVSWTRRPTAGKESVQVRARAQDGTLGPIQTISNPAA